jgi:DNA-binding winged helix-turn-helix (wHTH) protein
MVETVQKRTFGVSGRQFCLEIRYREGGDRRLSLALNGKKLKGQNVEPRTLKVLDCLTLHAQQIVSRNSILQEVWGEKAATSGELDPGGNIDRHISRLREVFDDDSDPEESKFIKTEQGYGLKFLLPVETETEKLLLSPLTTAQVRGVLNVLKHNSCHRYHLTLDKQGKPVWIYTLIDFTKSDVGDNRLQTEAPVLLEANATDADREMNMCDFEAIPYGSHLLIKSRRSDGTSDMCVELYPHAGTQKLPFCGVRIHDTWFRTTVASSVSILSIGFPLKEFEGVRFEDIPEGPVDEPRARKLRTMWEQHNEVVRLPLDWPELPHQQEARLVSRNPRELFKVDVPYYHYHLTLTKKREPIWIAKIIRFQVDKYGSLFAHTPVLPFRGAIPSDHLYEVTPTFLGQHLVIQSRRVGSDSDMTVQLFPYADSSQFPSLYCASILRTQTNTFASSIAILSTEPVGGEIEGPVDDEHAAKLLAAWENHAPASPEIVRLPFAPDVSPKDDGGGEPPSPKGHADTAAVLEVGRWKEADVDELLLETLKEDREKPQKEITIWTTFHINPSKRERTIQALVDSGVKIEMLFMNYKNDGLLKARFRQRVNWPAYPRAYDEIERQYESMCKIAKASNGLLQVKLCDTMPFGAFYRIDNRVMLVGLLLSVESWEWGPLLKFYPESPQWAVLLDNWKAAWENPLDDPENVGSPFISSHKHQQIITDTDFIKEIEAKTPADSEIWVASHDLSNVADGNSDFSELVRRVVRENVARGLVYTYVYAEDRVGEARVETLREALADYPSKLRLHALPQGRFDEISLVSSHFISFNPLDKHPIVYMQLPSPQAQKGWIKLSKSDAGRVMTTMKRLMNEYPASMS